MRRADELDNKTEENLLAAGDGAGGGVPRPFVCPFRTEVKGGSGSVLVFLAMSYNRYVLPEPIHKQALYYVLCTHRWMGWAFSLLPCLTIACWTNKRPKWTALAYIH